MNILWFVIQVAYFNLHNRFLFFIFNETFLFKLKRGKFLTFPYTYIKVLLKRLIHFMILIFITDFFLNFDNFSQNLGTLVKKITNKCKVSASDALLSTINVYLKIHVYLKVFLSYVSSIKKKFLLSLY